MAPTRTHSLRIVEDPLRPEDLESLDVDVPSDEIAPGISLENGVMHIDHGDGSTTIDFEPKPEPEAETGDEGFYSNLVSKIESDELDRIAADLLDGIERDIQSREEWLETRARGIQLLGLKLEEPRKDAGADSAPLEGMSTVRHPLLLDATINFQATARGELLPATGPVKVRNDTPVKSPSSESAQPSAPLPPGPMAGGPGLSPPAPPAPQGFQEGGTVTPVTPGAALGAPPPPSQQQQQPSAEKSPQQNPLQAANPMATELAIPPSEEKDSVAAALETDFNHYLTTTAKEYYADTDRMLFYIAFGGDGFKKVYNCPLRRRPVSESVDAENLIVSNSSTDLANCPRITHRIMMRRSLVRRMQILGVYADVELQTPQRQKMDAVQEQKNELEGINPFAKKPDELDHEMYETCCELELDQFAPSHFKGEGLALPYRVTIEKTSRKILSIIRNWKEDDEQCLPKQFFVQFPFIRGLGFYGLGFIHLLGNTTSTLTAMWREMTDSGMFSNFPGFLFSKSAGRQLSNIIRIPPGGGMGLDVMPGQRIQDAVMPVPYKEPGGGFTAFAQWVEQAGQRLGQTSQIAVGEGKQEVPVGTTLALIEQATKIINSAHKRLHAAQAEEFQLLKERFREDPEAFWRGNKTPAMKWEKVQFLKALDDYNIVPVADPNNPTSLHRAAKAQIIEGLASKYPQIVNLQASLKRIFRIAGIDTEGLLYDQPLPPPPDPRMVAIQQKAESTAQTVQQQTQAATAKAIGQLILGLKQVEQKQQDAQSRAMIEQARFALEASQHQREGQQKLQEMHLDRVQKAQELAATHAQTQQELAADRARKQQEMGMDMVGRAIEGHTEALSAAHEGRIEHLKARQEHIQRQQEHAWEMRRRQQEHAQNAREHEQKMRHQNEIHAAELKQARALARIKPKSDTSKKK